MFLTTRPSSFRPDAGESHRPAGGDGGRHLRSHRPAGAAARNIYRCAASARRRRPCGDRRSGRIYSNRSPKLARDFPNLDIGISPKVAASLQNERRRDWGGSVLKRHLESGECIGQCRRSLDRRGWSRKSSGVGLRDEIGLNCLPGPENTSRVRSPGMRIQTDPCRSSSDPPRGQSRSASACRLD